MTTTMRATSYSAAVICLSLMLSISGCATGPPKVETVRVTVPESLTEPTPIPAPTSPALWYLATEYTTVLQSQVAACNSDKAAIANRYGVGGDSEAED